MRNTLSLALALSFTSALLVACPNTKDTTPGDDTASTDVPLDQDGDGFAGDEDCDDSNASINPNGTEICDGLDNDCNGETDEGVMSTFYQDADGDGFGDASRTQDACQKPDGYVPTGTDCDDTNAEIFPGKVESCDGLDNNCNEIVDEGVSNTYYADADNDGFGDAAATTTDCAPPSGYVSDNTDCDDTTAAANPLASEICDEIDNDCDDDVDEAVTTTYYADLDEDGYGDDTRTTEACAEPTGYTATNGDCDDDNPNVNPGMSEYCDEIDNDCDGDVDEGATDYYTFYRDGDGDGYGSPTTTTEYCAPPSGFVADGTDCNDGEASINPGAPEQCNGVDDDCDGTTDESDSSDTVTWYQDADNDGFGNAAVTVNACAQPAGYVLDASDCDDAHADANPGAPELCDGYDNDCDGTVDEKDAVDVVTWYRDLDGDGYGSTTSIVDCNQPSDYVAADGDCNDRDPLVNPGVAEVCDGTDNDCDGTVDEDAAADASTWYADADGDGYGDASVTTEACAAPSGYVADATDCDDTIAFINPGSDEICNAIDDNCDGLIDDPSSADARPWFQDRDEDGYGDSTKVSVGCRPPSGYVGSPDDCDDLDPEVNPAATEICDGADNDCDGDVDENDSAGRTPYYADMDGDGYGDAGIMKESCAQPTGFVADATDCDDHQAAVNPGASEGCNGFDDDCDGLVDEADSSDASTWYADTDADGYGDAASTTVSCSAPTGYVANDDDCNDTSAVINPAASEYCNSIDDDCDGLTDETSAIDAATWYQDRDEDGYGDATRLTNACTQPSGYVSDKTDCNDFNSTINPAATEACNGADDDCDGATDEAGSTGSSMWYQDADSDGYGDAGVALESCGKPSGFVADSTDCDDSVAAVNPAATETCNGVDDDCDGTTDEASASGASTWYRDADSDGYGNASTSTVACTAPSGYVADKTDCDDASSSVHPSATEYCNGVDDDCDGSTDETSSSDAVTWYIDRDDDGYGDATRSTVSCTAPSGYVADRTDCNDLSATVHPYATEYCNGVDDDCDGTTDETSAADASTWYLDSDGDGYGNPSSSTLACSKPSGYVADKTDCNDSTSAVNPGATEYCNGVDDDCDGTIDEASASDASTWYQDADTDGYGNASVTTKACTKPTGYVSTSGDCNDAASTVNPGATEYCNGVDDDCDGSTDETSAADASTWYQDADADNYGNASVTTKACTRPTGYVADKTDCNDSNNTIYPGATEICDVLDNDCDGSVDEGAGSITWYRDADSDGYGTSSTTTVSCTKPTGYVMTSTDCNDANAAVYPGATEKCNGVDDDCDGSTDESDASDASTWYQDSDADGYGDASVTTKACTKPTGYVSDKTDCNDTKATVNPAASEYCNSIDDDCDGTADESAVDATTYYRDSDSDGYGNASSTTKSCSLPSGYVTSSTDCDDTSSSIHPGASETCNSKDDDCDGTVDESPIDGTTYYRDSDSDKTGDAGSTMVACTTPSGYVSNDYDCNDADRYEPVVVDIDTGSSTGAGTMTSPKDSVQDGIDLADECVIVFAGTYSETIDFGGKLLEVTGVEGAESTIIDASHVGGAVATFNSGESSAAVLEGFTLTGGTGYVETTTETYMCTSILTCYKVYTTYCGGGVYMDGADPTLMDVIVTENSLPVASSYTSGVYTYYTLSYGGGVCMLDSTASVSGFTVSDNFADQGGGIYLDETSSASFLQGWILQNYATDGAGTEVDGGTVNFTNILSYYNVATYDGGGVYVIGGALNETNVTHSEEYATTGGGIYLSTAGRATVMNAIVYGSASGKGVLVDGGSTFSGTYNNVYGNVGGNYSGMTDPTGTSGNISKNPSFTSSGTNYWVLSSTSSSKDAGNPSSAYYDADGTRNDQGAFGGPFSTWWL